MIYKNGSNAVIERHKTLLGLTGDVYRVGHFLESLTSHKQLISDSKAETIEDAEVERVEYEAKLEAERSAAEQAADESKNAEESSEASTIETKFENSGDEKALS